MESRTAKGEAALFDTLDEQIRRERRSVSWKKDFRGDGLRLGRLQRRRLRRVPFPTRRSSRNTAQSSCGSPRSSHGAFQVMAFGYLPSVWAPRSADLKVSASIEDCQEESSIRSREIFAIL